MAAADIVKMKTADKPNTEPTQSGSVVIGLGANIGHREAIVDRFRAAVSLLSSEPRWRLVRTSSLYFGPAVDACGPGFFNAAVLFTILSDIQPNELIHHVLGVETSLGRQRPAAVRNAPRTIDLDVLWWDGKSQIWPGPPILQVPHPRLLQRRFAVEPCMELLGGAIVISSHDPDQLIFGDAHIACIGQPLDVVGEWFTLTPDV
jgi:2-amino-4-hydroxy-6-hydroxymethyldihydropteridine diphosphokinase